MKKIMIGIVVIVCVVSVAGGGYLYVKGNQTKPPLAVTISPAPTETPQPEELMKWEDQAEFSFEYPKSLTVNPHEEDQVNYAHVELTSSEHPGYLIVWVKDTTAKTIEEWVTQTKPASPIDTTLDGVSAKKVRIPGETPVLQMTAIRDGYLYQIETKLLDEQYWNGIYDTITKSFKFVASQPQAPAPQTGGSDTSTPVTMEEEVIE